jgi:hypothetical protein
VHQCPRRVDLTVETQRAMNSVEISSEYVFAVLPVRAYELEAAGRYPDDDLRARTELELAEDTLDMSLDGSFADDKAL